MCNYQWIYQNKAAVQQIWNMQGASFCFFPWTLCLSFSAWNDTHSRQQGRSETEEYSSDSESESEDEEELQMILEDLQKQNEELEVRRKDVKIFQSSSLIGHLLSPTLFSYCC